MLLLKLSKRKVNIHVVKVRARCDEIHNSLSVRTLIHDELDHEKAGLTCLVNQSIGHFFKFSNKLVHKSHTCVDICKCLNLI